MRYLIRTIIPAILAVVGLLALVHRAAATTTSAETTISAATTPQIATFFEKWNQDEIETEELWERPFFSTDVDCYLGQKYRRRGGGGRIWANLYYGDTALKPKGADSKIKPNLYGLQVGLDLVQSHGVYTTFFGNFNQSEIKYANKTNAQTENYLFGIGKYIYLSGCHFGGSGSFGYDQYKVKNSSYQLNAKGNGLQCNLFGEFGIDFIFGKWGIKPFYALQYDFLYHGRIGEADTPFQGDWNGHGLSQLFGVRLNWKLFESFELQSRLTWVHEMLDNPPVYYHARFSAVHGTSSPAVFFYEGNTGRDWAWIGFGLKFEGVYNVFLFLDYDLMINARHTTHLGNLGLCFGW